MATVKQEVISMVSAFPETVSLDEIIEALKNIKRKKEVYPLPQQKSRSSFLEAAQEYLGCIEDAPEDLSTNKHYMEGYGQ